MSMTRRTAMLGAAAALGLSLPSRPCRNGG